MAVFTNIISAADAFALKERFVLHFTPKCSSWVNMIAIEFSALSRHILNCRTPNKETLIKKLDDAMEYRNKRNEKIIWQFSIQKARNVFNSKYHDVCPENTKNKII